MRRTVEEMRECKLIGSYHWFNSGLKPLHKKHTFVWRTWERGYFGDDTVGARLCYR